MQGPCRLTLGAASDPCTTQSSVFSVGMLPEIDASLPTCCLQSLKFNPYDLKGNHSKRVVTPNGADTQLCDRDQQWALTHENIVGLAF